jgi:hypothetical protein
MLGLAPTAYAATGESPSVVLMRAGGTLCLRREPE